MSALGSSSFSKVSTGFTTDSKAMVPVSIQGMGGQVQKMSIFDSMQEAFFEIRDGVDNLAVVFTDKISALNEHLAFRFESLNQTLMRIANISDEDLDLEEQQTKFAKDKAIEDDRDKSLRDDNKGDGSSILDTLKERFNSLLDLLAPQSEIAKVGLLGLLTLGIMTQLPKLEKALEGVFKFTGEKLIPFIDSIFDIKDDETGEFKWDRILGVGLGAYLTAKIAPALLGLVFKAGGLSLIGITGLAVWATASAFQAAGDWAAAKDWTKELGASDNETLNKISGLLAGDLEGGIMNAFKNASKFAGIGATAGFLIGGPVGAIIGGVIGGAVGGVLGWIGGGNLAKGVDFVITGFNNLWNNLTQGISDFFNDREIVGPGGESYTQQSGMGKIKDQMMENFKNNIQSIKDFFFDEQGNLFGISFSGLRDMLPTLQQIADSIVSSLPKWMRPDTLNEKISDKKASIAKDKDELSRSLAGDDTVYFGFDGPEQKRVAKRIAKEEQELAALENEMKQTFPDVDMNLSNGNGSAITQSKELKKNIAIQKESMSGMGTGGNAVVIDNSKKSNDKTVVGGTTVQGSARVEGISSGDAFMSYLYRQQT